MKSLLFVMALFALHGCTSAAGFVPVKMTAQDEEVQRAALMRSLKDPSSAQVEDVRVYQNPKGARMICSKVNGRNSFGGYAGFQVLTVQTAPGIDYSKPFMRPATSLGGLASIDCAGAGYPV